MCLITTQVARIILIGINVSIVLIAIIHIVVTQALSKREGKLIDTSLGYVGLVGSIITLIVGLFGIIAAWFRNYCLLTAYSIFMVVAFVCQSISAIVALKAYFRIGTEEHKEYFLDLFNNDKFINTNLIQEYFQCCGVDGPEDYDTWKKTIPLSCCIEFDKNGECDGVYPHGCYDLILGKGEIYLALALIMGIAACLWLAGLGITVVGVLYLLDINKVTDAIPNDFSNISVAPILSIVVGSTIFIISFMGCYGAFIGSHCLLKTYAVLLLVLFLFQIAVGIFAFLEIKDKHNLEVGINNTLPKLFNNYDKYKEVVNVMQTDLHCCGLNGTTFWNQTSKSGQEALENCCEFKDLRNCNHYYDAPCPKAFYDFIDHSMNTIGIIVLTFSALEVLGAIFSLCLANSIRNDLRRGRYA